MDIQVPTVVLDGTVLAILAKEDTYGYVITKTMQEHMNVSESTMYPVLRRLKKNNYLINYDEPYEGRIRRYYQITDEGRAHLVEIQAAWKHFRTSVNTLLLEEEQND
ncbi:PadR family transcriptional regulator [Weissella tructae]|jgi:PadR family transcriptional regulator PadR|uniref:Transcriptional regulator n=2 Tax=Weissella TaxID=46255 RepID=A0A075TZL6_9LACO|nr:MULTISPECIES: PadR family transcriptional regulator [Weissella]AIG65760.1 Transcriptional regulator [Weissella tructae]AIM63139.1 Transcriptional regulator [Weissella ceti]AIM64475.1 Transcriptional regulator [Weissella ceti]ELA06787.1 transcriptional regulator [Weissella ceti NC36]QVV90923.1 PadR family transcriptional regulator [Weissella tructae]